MLIRLQLWGVLMGRPTQEQLKSGDFHMSAMLVPCAGPMYNCAMCSGRGRG